MSGDVDELFGQGGRQARPRTTRIVTVLITGLFLTITGMLCTAVPGGLVTLVAWALVERELERVDSGFLALDYRPGLVTLRALVWASLLLVLGLFAVQLFLLCTGFYTALWTGAIEAFRPLVLPSLPASPGLPPP